MDLDDPTPALIRKAQDGCREAFDELARRFAARIDALVAARMGNALRQRLDVEDVRQEVLLRAFQSIGKFRLEGEDAFIRWLGGIAENVILKEAERLRVRQSVSLNGDLPAQDSSVGTRLRRSERFDRLKDAIERLSPEHREVILLARIEKLPGAEIARRMNRSPAAVAQLLSRALKKLREIFGETDSLHLPPRLLEETDGTTRAPHETR